MTLVHQDTPSQHLFLHPFLSSLGDDIVDTLEHAKSRKKFKLDLASIDFDNIEVCDVKYIVTTLAYVYDCKYYKVSAIACCDKQSKDGGTQTFL